MINNTIQNRKLKKILCMCGYKCRKYPQCAIFIFNKAYTVNISYSYNIHKTYPARHRYS